MTKARFCGIDPVNFDHVQELADDTGLEFEQFFPKEGRPDTGGVPALVDLDHWVLTRDDFRKTVRDLIANPPTTPVGVFSYNLDENQTKSLEARGMRVYPRLNAAAVADFERAVNQFQRPAEKPVAERPVIVPSPSHLRRFLQMFGWMTRV
jgi:hypothetical protein